MNILGLILVLVIVGVLLWGIGQMPFIDAGIKKVIYVIVIVCVVVWLISALFGVSLGNLGNVRIR